MRRAALRPLAAACILAVAGSPVMAQETVKWIRTFAGDYDVVGNWFPAVVPGPMDIAVLGVLRPDRGYEVRIDQDAAVGWLAFENPLAVVKIEEGATFTVGRVTGRGRLIVSDSADVFISRLRLGDGATVEADISMNREFSTIERAGSGDAPVFGADTSIRGQGFLIGDFVVLGDIEARFGRMGFQSGTTTLGPDSIVRAVPGIPYRAAFDGWISGGTWRAGVGDEAGVLEGDGTGGITDARLEGVWTIEPRNDFVFGGDISGPGSIVIRLDPTAGFSRAIFASGATIGVDVILTRRSTPPAGGGSIGSLGVSDPPIFLPDTTISGSGWISGSYEMQGRVEAVGDDAVIEFSSGRLSATPDAAFVVDAGQFVFRDSSLTGGRIEASNDGLVFLDNSTVEGAVLSGTDGAVVRGFGTMGGSLVDCTIEGDWQVNDGTGIGLGGVFDGPGTLTLGRSSPTSTTNAGVASGALIEARIRLATDGALLSADPAAEAPTLGPNSVVSGRGRISGGFVIQSDIVAEGGRLALTDGDFALEPGVTMRALSGASLAVLADARVTGGTWDGGSGTNLAGDGFGTIVDGRFEGRWRFGSIRLAGHATGTGTLAAPAPGRIPVETDTTLDVHLFLEAAPDERSSVVLSRLPGGGTATIGVDGILSGNGLTVGNFTIAGTLRPGLDGEDEGVLDPRAGTLTLTETARVEIRAAGPADDQHGRIAGTGDIELAGTLSLNFADGYTPGPHDVFEVVRMRGSLGTFDDISVQAVPGLEPIGPPHAVYDDGSVRLVLCAADRDGDGELTAFDLLAYINQVADGDPQADLDADGELTVFDFLAFQNKFQAGCE